MIPLIFALFKQGSLLEPFLSRLPVDDLPDRLEVLGLAVLVLETVVISNNTSINISYMTY